jgi:hypothetical protein
VASGHSGLRACAPECKALTLVARIHLIAYISPA